MPTDNAIRLVNLYGLLLKANEGEPATTAALIDAVPYDDYEVANGRWNLGADRNDLAEIGIPIREGTTPNGAPGWWIAQNEYFRAGLHLSDGERSALGRATRAIDFRNAIWARLANMKVGTTGAPTETVAVFMAPKALPRLQEARAQQATITFPYKGEKRTVQPWGIGSVRGHWYLVGPEQEAPKVFRIDQIDEKKVRVGKADHYVVPDDFEIKDHLPADLFGWGHDLIDVTVAVDTEIATLVAREVGERLTMADRDDGRTELAFSCNHRGVLLSWLLALGPRAEVIGPADVRAEVVAHLRAMVEAADGP
jgi:predicted DNA-binding transcriptional regulator YafY